MPLQKQIVPIALGLGLDQKSDPKVLLPGKLVQAQNVRFSKAGAIDPRPVFGSLGDNTPKKFTRLFGFGAQTLGLSVPAAFGDAQSLYRHDEFGRVWHLVGDMPAVPRALMRKVHTVPDVMFADSAVNSNSHYMCIASIAGAPGSACTATIVDMFTSRVIATLSIASAVSGVRVLRHPSSATFVVVANVGSSIKVWEIDPTQSSPSATLQLTISVSHGSTFFKNFIDAICAPGAGYLYVAYADVTGGTSADVDVVIAQIDPSGWTVAHSNRETIGTALGLFCLAVPENNPAQITVCAWDSSSNNFWFKQANKTNVATTVTAKTTIVNDTSGESIVAIEQAADTSYPLKVVIQSTGTGEKHYKISSGGSSTLVVTNRGLGIASRPCRVDTARIMFWSQYFNSTFIAQSAFFLSEFGAQYVPRAMLGSTLVVRKDTAASYLSDFPALHAAGANTFRSMAVLNGGSL